MSDSAHMVGAASAGADDDSKGEQDRLLPIANISRIMKRVLPAHAKMSKESKAAIQECVSEFIAFITSEAADRLSVDRRKTITADDIIKAINDLGFTDYGDILRLYLSHYQHSVKTTKKNGTNAGGYEDDDEPTSTLRNGKSGGGGGGRSRKQSTDSRKRK